MNEWSAIAVEWHELWGSFAEPAQRRIIEAAGIGDGTRVLDVGCGSGEFLAILTEAGAIASGVDPAEGMVALAAAHADARVGDAEHLPFDDASFDVVTAVNAFQFADDPVNALVEFARVLAPGGLIAIANWAEAALNDIDTIERALAGSDGDDGGESALRLPGGQEELLAGAGFAIVANGLVEAPWHAADDDILVRGVLLGEDADAQQRLASTVREAAAPYRSTAGGYVLVNSLRFAIARTAS